MNYLIFNIFADYLKILHISVDDDYRILAEQRQDVFKAFRKQIIAQNDDFLSHNIANFVVFFVYQDTLARGIVVPLAHQFSPVVAVLFGGHYHYALASVRKKPHDLVSDHSFADYSRLVNDVPSKENYPFMNEIKLKAFQSIDRMHFWHLRILLGLHQLLFKLFKHL